MKINNIRSHGTTWLMFDALRNGMVTTEGPILRTFTDGDDFCYVTPAGTYKVAQEDMILIMGRLTKAARRAVTAAMSASDSEQIADPGEVSTPADKQHIYTHEGV